MKTLFSLTFVSIVSISQLTANDAFQADLKKNRDPAKKVEKRSPKEAIKEHAKASIQTADGQD